MWLSLFAQPASAMDSGQLLRRDYYVGVRSTVPAIAGQVTPLYVREVVRADTTVSNGVTNPVVLFVHGAGSPSEVVFDVPYSDYSWMEFLARAGFDAFAVDLTGYGRSTRPAPMNDPCNLSRKKQLSLAQGVDGQACLPSYGQEMTTLASDWNDISSVVDYLLALRHVSQISMVSWSLGGPRAGGYAAQHPDIVKRLVLLAPVYDRGMAANAPAKVPAIGPAMNTLSHDEFMAQWNGMVGCPGQYDQAVSNVVWKTLLESDPVGATWGSGVRRAPNVANWGDWTTAAVSAMPTPTLMVTGDYDNIVVPKRVDNLYADLGSHDKVLVHLACSSHNAMWEKNHLVLFRASLEWLTKGTVNGMAHGVAHLGK
jgi:pimeloyl-ACP methyl ester carboxylesterase